MATPCLVYLILSPVTVVWICARVLCMVGLVRFMTATDGRFRVMLVLMLIIRVVTLIDVVLRACLMSMLCCVDV